MQFENLHERDTSSQQAVNAKKGFFYSIRNDSAYDSVQGSSSDNSHTLHFSSLSSFTSLDSTKLDDDQSDVFSDVTVTATDTDFDDAESQIISSSFKDDDILNETITEVKPDILTETNETPQTSTTNHDEVVTLSKTPKTNRSGETRKFDSWEAYHRSDTSRDGLLFLYIYLKNIPGRQKEATETLTKWRNYDQPVQNQKPKAEIIKPVTKPKAIIRSEVQLIPDKVGYKSDGATTDDQSNHLSKLYKKQPRVKKRRASVKAGRTKETTDFVKYEKEGVAAVKDKMTLVAKLDVPRDIKSVSLYAEDTFVRPVHMVFETEDPNYSLHVKSIFRHGRSNTNVKRENSYMSSFSLEAVSPVLQKITIPHQAWAKNGLFKSAETLKIHTDVDWSVGYGVSRGRNMTAVIPSAAREFKFVINGTMWAKLDTLPVTANAGWNANNLI